MTARSWTAIAALILLPQAAFAHAMLERADPGAGAVLRVAPQQLRLEFSEALEPAFSGVTVTDDRGGMVSEGTPAISNAAMSVGLRPLVPGVYRVLWHAVSVDMHRTEGSYTFSIAP